MVHVRPVQGCLTQHQFFNFPYKLFRNDPYWIPSLWGGDRSILKEGKRALPRVEVQPFIAYRGFKVVGRIAAMIHRGYNRAHRNRFGFFGLFDSVLDDEVFGFLIDAAASWLREQGREGIRGPVDFFSPFNCGILAEGFHHTPPIGLSYHPEGYSRRLEHFGFKKKRDLYLYQMGTDSFSMKAQSGVADLRKERKVHIRPLDLSSFERDIQGIHRVYRKAWERLWGYLPISGREFLWYAERFRPYLDPDLILVAQVRHETVGFSVTLPDFHQALRVAVRRRLPFGLVRRFVRLADLRGVRVALVGVLPEKQRLGIGTELMYETWRRTMKAGYATITWGGILEGLNPLHQALHRWGARICQVYRLYERQLT